jgi:general secretion pathway protein K
VIPVRRTAASGIGARRDRGFALLIVLWTLVLIAFLVLHLTASGRTEIRIADNLVDNAVAAAAADGAISEAIFNLSNPRPDQRWPLDGAAHSMTIGDSRVTVRLADEAARINPNLASPVLIEALLRAVGSDPATAQRLAAAIADWVGSATTAQPQAALFAEYRAAGLDYGPPGSPLEGLDELGQVLGMTPALLAALRPHLTLYGPPEPDPVGADPVVAAALALIPQLTQASSAIGASPQDVLTVRITASSLGPGNVRVTRTAIVRVGSTLPQGYVVLAWGRRVA